MAGGHRGLDAGQRNLAGAADIENAKGHVPISRVLPVPPLAPAGARGQGRWGRSGDTDAVSRITFAQDRVASLW